MQQAAVKKQEKEAPDLDAVFQDYKKRENAVTGQGGLNERIEEKMRKVGLV